MLPVPKAVQSMWGRGGHLGRGSVNLILNNIAGSVLGFAGWMVISRLFDPSDVGMAAAALSVVNLAANGALLGTTTTLVRFLPTDRDPRELVQTSLTIIVPVAAVLTAAAVGLSDHDHRVAWTLLGVVLGTATAGKAVLEAAVTALRGAGTIVVATSTSTLARTVAAAGVGALLASPLSLLALQIAAPASGVWILARHLYRQGILRGPWRPRMRAVREYGGYSAVTYLNTLIAILPGLALPSLVLHRLGPERAAHWYIAMLIAGVFFLLPAAVGQALLVEAAHDLHALPRLVRQAALAIAAVMVPAVAVGFLLAPVGLNLFGSDYTNAASSLRLLIVSAILISVNYVAGTVLTAHKRILPMIITNSANAIVVLLLVITWANDLDDVALAWLIGEIVNVVLFVVFAKWATSRRPSTAGAVTTRG